jgi:hypothetical protein
LRGALQFLDRDDATSANEIFNEAMAVPTPPDGSGNRPSLNASPLRPSAIDRSKLKDLR